MPTLLYLLVFLVPLGTRLVIGLATPAFHEYEGLFLYATDFFLLLFVIVSLYSDRRMLRTTSTTTHGSLLIVFLLAALASFISAPSLLLAGYTFLRLIIIVFASLCIAHFINSKKRFQIVIAVLAASAIAQAALGIMQFARQESIGLGHFGEPSLVSYTGAASTIKVEGGRILRAYGTFPHPNVLGAFLALGFICCGYLYVFLEQRLSVRAFPKEWRSNLSLSRWRALRRSVTSEQVARAARTYFNSREFSMRMLVAAFTFITALGLVLTFSRGAWYAAVMGIVILVLCVVRSSAGTAIRLLLMYAVAIAFAVGILYSMVVPRAQVRSSEPAVADRITYNHMGLSLIREEPLGVGIGNQVLYSVQNKLYQMQEMKRVWQWEPIHMLYILVAVELGWFGLLSFLALLGIVCWQLAKAKHSLEVSTALALLGVILAAGIFDHFLWTLQPGRLMLWLVIGLALSQLTHKSEKAG